MALRPTDSLKRKCIKQQVKFQTRWLGYLYAKPAEILVKEPRRIRIHEHIRVSCFRSNNSSTFSQHLRYKEYISPNIVPPIADRLLLETVATPHTRELLFCVQQDDPWPALTEESSEELRASAKASVRIL